MISTGDEAAVGRTLAWLVGLLDRHGVPYQVVGGLAARAYGSERRVADIDLYVPFERAAGAIAEVRPWIIRSPGPRRSESWDMTYFALEREGVFVEVADATAGASFWSGRDRCWEPQAIDFSRSVRATILGVDVDVMPLDELVRYKASLDRPVDRDDIRAIDPAYLLPPDPEPQPRPAALALDLATFDPARFAPLLAGLAADGFRLTSLGALGDGEEERRRLYELNTATVLEAPGSDGRRPWSGFDEFRSEICGAPWFDPHGQVVAIEERGGDWVAMAAVARFAGSEHAWNLHTGVQAGYRGRGLGRAVLALAARHARDALGATALYADENPADAELIAAYLALGYVDRA